MILPLQCVNCNAPLELVDAPALACRFCGSVNAMPEAYRQELRLSRDLDEATRHAIELWARLARLRTARWWFVCAASAPFVLMVLGLAIIAVIGVLGLAAAGMLPLLVAISVWFPLVPLQLIAANVGMRNILESGAASIWAAFAASPPTKPGAPPNCRQCGAPLSILPDDILVRCVYCNAESIVQLDQSGWDRLRSRLGSARSSLAQAVFALKLHARLAKLQTRGRTGVIAGLLILPLIWSFVESWSSTYWSLLIAMDVWLLSVCVFWSVREAFLPPVTMEELDALRLSANEIDSGKGAAESRARAPGTRGWYEHSSDKVNFVIPLFVTLVFVAIEIITLTKSYK
jgi:DNA-directed RNA polymerase subunit RPC12/RpoP